eukprot:2627114-Rhodomonas_salina.1
MAMCWGSVAVRQCEDDVRFEKSGAPPRVKGTRHATPHSEVEHQNIDYILLICRPPARLPACSVCSGLFCDLFCDLFCSGLVWSCLSTHSYLGCLTPLPPRQRHTSTDHALTRTAKQPPQLSRGAKRNAEIGHRMWGGRPEARFEGVSEARRGASEVAVHEGEEDAHDDTEDEG